MRDLIRDDDRVPLAETLAMMRREGRRRLLPMAVLFAIVGAVVLAIGWNWPKKYFASTTILVAEDKTIEKLMEGRAVTTSVADRAGIVREVIFSRKVMDDVLELGGWLADHPGPAERAQRADTIQGRTQVGAPRENLIRIEYWDTDPQRALKVVQRFADRFLFESRAAQVRESREAHDFIADQARVYHDKLLASERALAEYREHHPEARSEPLALTETRLAALRQRLERDQAALGAASPRRTARPAPGAPAVIEDPRRAALQDELVAARLRYTDAHPDVRRLQRQLAALDARPLPTPALATSAIAATGSGGGDVPALRQRIAAAERELAAELERLRRSADPAPDYAELVREHEVARDLYQDLLRRLEYARLSLTMDEEGRGLSFRTHEPPTLPARPSGARFAHFALGGLAAAAATPLGLLFLFVRLDPHVRSAGALRRAGLPVAATLPTHWNTADRRLLRRDLRIAASIVGCTVVAFAVAGALRLAGAA